jgi:DNA-directed RNA polymerase specialized sigma24 family protein
MAGKYGRLRALTRLEAIDPRGAEIVALRFFSSLSVPEVADHLGFSVSTVEVKWTHARGCHPSSTPVLAALLLR